MATVGPLVDELLNRLRDPGAAALPRSEARRALAYGFGYSALAYREHLESFSLTTTRKRLIYALPELSERIVRVVRVEYQNRDIPLATLPELAGLYGADWARRQSHKLDAYVPVGRRLLILYPGLLYSQTVTIHCRAFPTLVTDDSDTVPIADDLIPYAMACAETQLLLQMRRTDRIQAQLQRMKTLRLTPSRLEPVP